RQRLLEVGGRDMRAVRGLGIGIEGPDLHALITLGDEALGERAGIVEEAVKILIGLLLLALRRQAPIADKLLRLGADIAIAGAGIVGADCVAAPPPEQLPDRLTRHLAED